MFFRASSSAQGSGLGLYIVKDTVEKLGGKITVQSKTGKGTVFTLLFPHTSPASMPDQTPNSKGDNAPHPKSVVPQSSN